MSGYVQFNALSFLLRWVFALVLVFASYNPSGYSYYHWVGAGLQDMLPAKIFLGVVLLIGWVIYFRAAWNSLGVIGLILASAFFGTLIWMIISWGVIPADSPAMITYIAEVALSAVLATGMSWSHIRRRLSGQVDTDEIER